MTKIIKKLRPPFLPGLAPGLEQLQEDLPTLEDHTFETSRRVTYAEQVENLREEFMQTDGRLDFIALAKVLGSVQEEYLISVLPNTDADEAVIQKTWIDVLHNSYPQTAQPRIVERHLLNGLLTNSRWRALLGSARDAYAFVVLAANFLGRSSGHSKEQPPTSMIRTQLKEAFSEWLPDGFKGDMTERDLAITFFGPAWAAIVYDSRSGVETLEHLILATSPAFLPGRLAFDVESVAQSLPSLE